MNLEIRIAAGIELRATDGKNTLFGYAAKYNRDSKPICGEFIERIAPGAFDRTLKEGTIDVRALFNHSMDYPLGRLGAKTLRLYTDDTGLRYEIDLADTTCGRDVRAYVEHGDVYGSSFKFRCQQDAWVYPTERGGMAQRTLLDCDLYDVSPVTDPAYEDTSVAIRSYTTNQPLDWTDTYARRIAALSRLS